MEQESAADLGIPLADAPVPSRPGQPCPSGIAAIKLTIAETARLARLARQHAAGLPSATPASPSICGGPAGAGGTRPAPGGTTTPPASPQPPRDERRPEGGDPS